MPEKRPSPLLESPPDASSSDEEMEEVVEEEVKGADNEEEDIEEEDDEEDEEEEEEEEEEDDGDDSGFAVKKVPSPQPQSSSLGEEEEEEEEEEESDSESGSDSDLPPESTKSTRAVNTVIDPTVKPITSIPMDGGGGNAKHKKSTEKPKPTTVTPSKRPAKTTDKQEDSKRRKRSGGGGDGEESEKKSSNKLWSEDDEVVILKGMVSLMKKGVKPTADMNVLLEHIKAGIHCDVTRDQLHNKIRRLKQKYLCNVKKEVGGEELQFSKTHDSKCYELSKKVWGEKDVKVEGTEASNGGVDSVKKEGKGNKSRKPAVVSPKLDTVVSPQIRNEVSTLAEQTPNLSPSPYFNELIDFGKNSIVPPEGLKGFLAKEGLELIGSSKAKALEEKWRKLQVAEAKIYLDRIELVREQVKMVLDALDSPKE